MSDHTEDAEDSDGALVQLSVNVEQFLQKLTGGSIEEFGGLLGDWFRYKRLEFATGRLEGAREMCRQAGIENPREVSLSTLAPWIEGASVEDEPSLQQMWESLLANASDPDDSHGETHRSFVRVLKRIEETEALVLEALYHMDQKSEGEQGVALIAGPYPEDEDVTAELEKMGVDQLPSEEQLNIAKLNLIRLGLCSRGGRRVMTPSAEDRKLPELQSSPKRIHISDFGRAFYEACQPPEPASASDSEPE